MDAKQDWMPHKQGSSRKMQSPCTAIHTQATRASEGHCLHSLKWGRIGGDRLVIFASSGHLEFGAIGARNKMAHLLYVRRLLKRAKVAGGIASYLPSSICLALHGPEAWGYNLYSHSSRGLHVGAPPSPHSSFQQRTQSKPWHLERPPYPRRNA